MTDNAQNPDYDIERFQVCDGEDMRIMHTVCGSVDPACFIDGDGLAWCTHCDSVEPCQYSGEHAVALPTWKKQRGGDCECSQ